MRAYKCDICGKLFEKKTFVKISGEKEIQLADPNNLSSSMDICSDCILAVQEILEERMGIENEQ